MSTIIEDGWFYIFVRDDGIKTKRKSYEVSHFIEQELLRGRGNDLERLADAVISAFAIKITKLTKGQLGYTNYYRDVVELCREHVSEFEKFSRNNEACADYCTVCGQVRVPWQDDGSECISCGAEQGS